MNRKVSSFILVLSVFFSIPSFTQELPPVDPLPDKVCEESDYNNLINLVPFCSPIEPTGSCFALIDCVATNIPPWDCEACLDIMMNDGGLFESCVSSIGHGVCRIK